MEGEKRKGKIGLMSGTMLVILALLFDAMSFIPVIGNFMAWVFWAIVSLYFWLTGGGIVNNKRIATAISSVAIESIPFISWIPSITVGMVAIILMSKFEDKTGISLGSLKSGAKMTPPRKKIPLNAEEGIRPPRQGTRNIPVEEISTAE